MASLHDGGRRHHNWQSKAPVPTEELLNEQKNGRRSMKVKYQTTVLATFAALSWSQAAHADAVVDWNAIAANTIAAAPSRSGPGSPVLFLDMAIVQIAVHDAVQALDGKFKPYHAQITGASGSPEAATAKAAHDVLVNIYPAQAAALDTTYREYLAKKGIGEDNAGI